MLFTRLKIHRQQFDPESQHGITFAASDEDATLFIPLQMNNVISYFPSRKPTPDELESCNYMVATSDEPWDPNSPSFETAEDEMNLAKPREVKSLVTTGNHNLYDLL